jgi:hypothetical protein
MVVGWHALKQVADRLLSMSSFGVAVTLAVAITSSFG